MLPSNLQKLLREFNVKGYADPSKTYEDNSKQGKLLRLQIDAYTYEDEFYGGEPYSGNETIWELANQSFGVCIGGKLQKGEDFGVLYSFLRAALAQGPSGNCVHRGPESYREADLEYTNECIGDITEFRQIERIVSKGKEVYIAYFNGGIINQKS
ncbi:MAG: DUF5680 domain-containing protein [Candidatus Dojkabacteria bacterium]|nr:MAG: DUF5680 domain-containing protein [Candidatus Dojkabacteria bacterium]